MFPLAARNSVPYGFNSFQLHYATESAAADALT